MNRDKPCLYNELRNMQRVCVHTTPHKVTTNCLGTCPDYSALPDDITVCSYKSVSKHLCYRPPNTGCTANWCSYPLAPVEDRAEIVGKPDVSTYPDCKHWFINSEASPYCDRTCDNECTHSDCMVHVQIQERESPPDEQPKDYSACKWFSVGPEGNRYCKRMGSHVCLVPDCPVYNLYHAEEPKEAVSEQEKPKADAVSEQGGRKDDSGKLRWDLLPLHLVEECVHVLTFGAAKYAPNNWQKVSDGRERYYAAAMRHLVAWRNGEARDPESGIPHLAHVMCNLVFLDWFDTQKEGDNAQSNKV